MATDFRKTTDYPSGVVPFTRAAIPAAYILVIGDNKIGYVQNIDENFDRPVTETYEVGSIGVVEGLPGQPKYSASISGVKIYGKNLLKAYMESAYSNNSALKTALKTQIAAGASGTDAEQSVFSLLIHNILPFDIQVRELDYGVASDGSQNDFVLGIDSKSKIVSIYKNCWITKYSKTVAVGTVNIIEKADIFITKVLTGV